MFLHTADRLLQFLVGKFATLFLALGSGFSLASLFSALRIALAFRFVSRTLTDIFCVLPKTGLNELASRLIVTGGPVSDLRTRLLGRPLSEPQGSGAVGSLVIHSRSVART